MEEKGYSQLVKDKAGAMLHKNKDMAKQAKKHLEMAIAAYVDKHGEPDVEGSTDPLDMAIIMRGVDGPLRVEVEQAHGGVAVAEAVGEILEKLLSHVSEKE